jgi:hypothetical protein
MEEKNLTDFTFFITSLSMQASIALGAIAHPISNKVEQNLSHAKLLIDTLSLLKEKTMGNLTTDEDSLLDKFIYELQQQYAKNQNNPVNFNKEGAQ